MDSVGNNLRSADPEHLYFHRGIYLPPRFCNSIPSLPKHLALRIYTHDSNAAIHVSTRVHRWTLDLWMFIPYSSLELRTSQTLPPDHLASCIILSCDARPQGWSQNYEAISWRQKERLLLWASISHQHHNTGKTCWTLEGKRNSRWAKWIRNESSNIYCQDTRS